MRQKTDLRRSFPIDLVFAYRGSHQDRWREQYVLFLREWDRGLEDATTSSSPVRCLNSMPLAILADLGFHVHLRRIGQQCLLCYLKDSTTHALRWMRLDGRLMGHW